MMEHQWNVQEYIKLIFVPPPPHGVWAKFTKKCCWELHEMPRIPQKINVWEPLLQWEGHWAISLKTIFFIEIARTGQNYMKQGFSLDFLFFFFP